jgi:hypothetical protein
MKVIFMIKLRAEKILEMISITKLKILCLAIFYKLKT